MAAEEAVGMVVGAVELAAGFVCLTVFVCVDSCRLRWRRRSQLIFENKEVWGCECGDEGDGVRHTAVLVADC